MADTAHSFLLPTEDREHPYPDSPSDPNKRKGKTFPAPAESALDVLRAGPKPRKRRGFRAIPRQGARFRRREVRVLRPVNTGRVEIVFQGWRAKYPYPRHEASRRREMRFHSVIILTMPRLRVRQGKPGHNEISPRNNLETRRAARRKADTFPVIA